MYNFFVTNAYPFTIEPPPPHVLRAAAAPDNEVHTHTSIHSSTMHALPNMCAICAVPTQGLLFALVANFIFHLVPATQTVPGAKVSCNIYTLTFKGAHALALNVLDCEKTKDGYSDVGLYFIVSETEREGVGGHHYEGASSLCDEWECLTVWVGITMSW
jgi:hypothetical protein